MPRGKTFTGCWTCRERRVKCDESRPECRRCSTKGIVCAGYETRLHWLTPISGHTPPEVLVSTDKKLQRRRLLPVNEIQTLTEDQVNRFLNTVEEFKYNDQQCIHGPFGVFQAKFIRTSADIDHEHPDGRMSTHDNLRCRTLSSQAQTVIAESDVGVTEDTTIDNASALPISDSGISTLTRLSDSYWNWQDSNASPDTSSAPSVFQTPSSSVITSDTESLTTTDARAGFLSRQVKFLLKHYRVNVLPFFSVLDNRQTTWRVLHFPKAMQAACELEIEETPEGASNILLHTILTISACSLQNLEQVRRQEQSSQRWEAIAIHYKGEALRLLTAQLNPCVSAMSESEYQELLAAILSMVSIDIICGDTRTCKLHLRACEALIRNRTKPSGYKLSPMSKALHTTFIYLKVMQTTASVSLIDMWSQGRSLRFSASSAIDATALLIDDDFSTFIDLDELDDGQFGSFSSEMMYGVPACLLLLLNNTISIIVRSTSNDSTRDDPGMNLQLRRDRDQLENRIIDWPVEDMIDRYRKASLSPGNYEVLVHCTQAFHQALVIFFYDKVHQTRSRLLQRYVQSVLYHLEQVEKAKVRYGISAGPLLWPAFVAGRQAIDVADQTRLISWLEESDKIGIGTSKATIERLRQFWSISEESSEHQAAIAGSLLELVLT